MLSLEKQLRSCLEAGLVQPTDRPDVYYVSPWTRAALREDEGGSDLRPIMGLNGLYIGSYHDLKGVVKTLRRARPSAWSKADIHHIVEHHHLQYLGRIFPVDDNSYEKSEPCVVLDRADHSLSIENGIGVAERCVLEGAPVDFVKEFQAHFNEKHPLQRFTDLPKREQTRHKVEWLKRTLRARRIEPQRIHEWLKEIYSLAYQDADLRPLREISVSVLNSMPV